MWINEFKSPLFTIVMLFYSNGLVVYPQKLLLFHKDRNLKPIELRRVNSLLALESGTWHQEDKDVTVCFDLPKGRSFIEA